MGNAFIDLGAMAIIRAAVPDGQIAFASEMPRWFFEHSAKPPARWLEAFSRRRGTQEATARSLADNALDIGSVTQCDLAVIAGMMMCEEFIQINGPSVLALSSRGVPVLLMGTGALMYSDQERRLFGDFLRRLKPMGFISRDDQSYELFGGFVSRTHKGIDCAFFVPDAYTPFPLHLSPYIVATFDSLPEPVLNLNGRQLIRAHHECWGAPRRGYVIAEKTLISDIPYDYLALYANADEVHSDRVHACVAALAYGRLARFYHRTGRAQLFDAVGAGHVKEAVIQLDQQRLAERKTEQIEVVRQLVASL